MFITCWWKVGIPHALDFLFTLGVHHCLFGQTRNFLHIHIDYTTNICMSNKEFIFRSSQVKSCAIGLVFVYTSIFVNRQLSIFFMIHIAYFISIFLALNSCCFQVHMWNHNNLTLDIYLSYLDLFLLNKHKLFFLTIVPCMSS
jgi:hypothetical protein